ncbi:fatty acid desaturase-domain-containing protein [Vararia minispora EC-137]|uniref:Fatty acid desaturase-domain-containing protein n=1 Tax=Vararia minispora EC-137 TaxID=1314806 RepID=A0ACB8QUG7_9AGAM|nr:fatty acid desaturase-domain-containing protein [Vararia minispora EC-137]
MKTVTKDGVTSVEQTPVVIPDLTVKDLLSSIPEHCFKRSAFKSSLYIVFDVVVIAAIHKTTVYAEQFITPAYLSFPHPALYTAAWVSLWALYGFFTGLFATGLWVIAHECGHQAFSESKRINNFVGWVLHSMLGVPYHSWRITHAKHHASTAHMTQDQVFVPKTRSELGLPKFNPDGEDLAGSRVTEEVMRELREAIGDSPLGATIGFFSYLLVGWPMYLIRNASGQKRYPKGTNHFRPGAVMFRPDQHDQIIISDVGIILWVLGVCGAIYQYGFADVFRLYLQAYLWVNHWLVLITFLQHTDPLLPHYRAPEFTFVRGALATFDRSLLGELGPIGAWLGAVATHGISETHVAHHVASKIPHYNAWEATYALRRRLEQEGITLQGRPGGWGEMYRVFRECRFVEDEGNIIFYKNASGLAASRPLVKDNTASDSGVDFDN